MLGRLKSIAGEFIPYYRYKGLPGAIALYRSNSACKKRPESVNARITSLQIEPTKYCNQQCSMCVNPAMQASEKGNMTFDQFKIVIDQFPYAYDVKLQGMGEIFLNPEIMEMIRYLNARGARVGFATNAVLLTDDIIQQLIEIGNLDVRFSIDTLDREKYHKIRGMDSLEKVKENVKNFLRARENSRKVHSSWKSQISTQIRCVLTKENIDDLRDIIIFAGDAGIEKVAISWALVKKYSESQSLYMEDRILSDVNDAIMETVITQSKELAERSNVELLLLEYPHDILATCKWPWRMPYITYDGYLMPCCNLEVPTPINLGNVLSHSFEDLWNGSKYKEFRRNFIDIQRNEFCKKCPFL